MLHDKLTELDGYARRGARLDVTFAAAAEDWLRHGAAERGCKPSTMRDDRNAARNLVGPVFGLRLLMEITPADIETWRASLTRGPRQKNRLLGMIVGI